MLTGITPKATRTPRQAQAELAKRTLAQRYFGDFCTYIDSKYLAVPHAKYLAEKLEQVARYIETGGREGIGRLMILMPPRHGKTELASIKFPAWLLGRLPDSRIILTSYGADLAAKNSRQMRDLVGSKRYQAVFGLKSGRKDPVMIAADSHSVQAWDVAQPHRGGVVATGVGGGITGLGATLLVIDDPFKNREEAESDGRREMVDDWYKSSAYTRLEQHGAVILFHTRWHPDDLAGRLIRRMVMDPQADQWEIVCLPGIASSNYPTPEKQRSLMMDGLYLPLTDPLGRTAGQALWPERFSAAWLLSKKANIGDYDFEALYQQLPYSREGGFFKREWFGVVENGPGKRVKTRTYENSMTLMARVRYWDKAASKNGDFTAGVLMSLGEDGYFYIEHVARMQVAPGERNQNMALIGREDYAVFGPFMIWHQQDPGSAGVDSAQETSDGMANSGLYVLYEPVSGDKLVRAGPLASKAQSGRVRLVRGAWNQAFLEEMAAFPTGRNDDQVDSASSALSKLLEIVELMGEEEPTDGIVVYEERVSISPV
jgi:predicted phage terminase large subunit-like protein